MAAERVAAIVEIERVRRDAVDQRGAESASRRSLPPKISAAPCPAVQRSARVTTAVVSSLAPASVTPTVSRMPCLRGRDRLARQRLERDLSDPIRERAQQHVLSLFVRDAGL